VLGWPGESTARCRRWTLAVRCRLCSDYRPRTDAARRPLWGIVLHFRVAWALCRHVGAVHRIAWQMVAFAINDCRFGVPKFLLMHCCDLLLLTPLSLRSRCEVHNCCAECCCPVRLFFTAQVCVCQGGLVQALHTNSFVEVRVPDQAAENAGWRTKRVAQALHGG
jgi:hypothetical protein